MGRFGADMQNQYELDVGGFASSAISAGSRNKLSRIILHSALKMSEVCFLSRWNYRQLTVNYLPKQAYILSQKSLTFHRLMNMIYDI